MALAKQELNKTLDPQCTCPCAYCGAGECVRCRRCPVGLMLRANAKTLRPSLR